MTCDHMISHWTSLPAGGQTSVLVGKKIIGDLIRGKKSHERHVLPTSLKLCKANVRISIRQMNAIGSVLLLLRNI